MSFGLVSLRSGCRFGATASSRGRPLIVAALRRLEMNLPRALARQFIGRQPPPLRVVVFVHLVRFAHWAPQQADLKVRLYVRVVE